MAKEQLEPLQGARLLYLVCHTHKEGGSNLAAAQRGVTASVASYSCSRHAHRAQMRDGAGTPPPLGRATCLGPSSGHVEGRAVRMRMRAPIPPRCAGEAHSPGSALTPARHPGRCRSTRSTSPSSWTSARGRSWWTQRAGLQRERHRRAAGPRRRRNAVIKTDRASMWSAAHAPCPRRRCRWPGRASCRAPQRATCACLSRRGVSLQGVSGLAKLGSISELDTQTGRVQMLHRRGVLNHLASKLVLLLHLGSCGERGGANGRSA